MSDGERVLMLMQPTAWEYVDSEGKAWRVLGQTSRVPNAYCLRGDEFAGAFDAVLGTLEEHGISRWPEVVRAKWREVVIAAQQSAAIALTRKAMG
jgi:hypothetical protein